MHLTSGAALLAIGCALRMTAPCLHFGEVEATLLCHQGPVQGQGVVLGVTMWVRVMWPERQERVRRGPLVVRTGRWGSSGRRPPAPPPSCRRSAPTATRCCSGTPPTCAAPAAPPIRSTWISCDGSISAASRGQPPTLIKTILSSFYYESCHSLESIRFAEAQSALQYVV